MAKRIQKVSLEKIAKEKLAKQTINAIDLIEVEVWENFESGLSLEISKKRTRFRLGYDGSTKKLLAWSGGISVVVGGCFTILKWLLPIVVAYFAKPPP